MDCEKYEPLLLDELYEELDEVTSAAVKRHVSGCARCASILSGMRGARRMAALPMLELPEGLEDRILSSVREAQKVVPIQSRTARFLSLAGSWAMRPQTAMAAVFLLMIGSSAFVIRSRQIGERADAVAVSVTEQGAPAGQTAPADDPQSLDNKAAAAAHGANQPAPITQPPLATLTPGGPVASAANGFGFDGDPAGSSVGTMDGLTNGKGRVGGNGSKEALGSALLESANKDKDSDGKKADEEQAPALDQRRAEKKAPSNNVATRGRPSDISNAGATAGAPPPAALAADDWTARSQSVAPPTTKQQGDVQDGYSAGMAAYRARNFPEALRQFDSAARTGDQNSALWAGRAVKDGSGGCGAALPRFDAVAQKSAGSWIGNEATLESARCQIAMGQLDPARDKLTKLTAVPSHAQAAQVALNELNQVAQKREADRAKGGSARPAAAAPARAPASPKAASTAAGF